MPIRELERVLALAALAAAIIGAMFGAYLEITTDHPDQ